jgi:hypothetical protein
LKKPRGLNIHILDEQSQLEYAGNHRELSILRIIFQNQFYWDLSVIYSVDSKAFAVGESSFQDSLKYSAKGNL